MVPMKNLLIALVVLVAPAQAGTVLHQATLTPAEQATRVQDFTGPIAPSIALTYPSFDTSLGTLVKVELIGNYTPTIRTRFENMSPAPVAGQLNWTHSHQVYFTYRPNPLNQSIPWQTMFGQNTATGYYSLILGGYMPAGVGGVSVPAFDGVLDYGGTSGFDSQIPYGAMYLRIINVGATSSREMEWWSQGTTRTVYLEPRTLSEHWYTWPGHWTAGHEVQMNFSSSITVRYTYN